MNIIKISLDEYLTILDALECYGACDLRDEVALQWELAERYGIFPTDNRE